MNIDDIPPTVKDGLERTTATFVQAFLSVFVLTDVSSFKSAAVAGAAAVLAVLKSWSKSKAAK